VSEAAAAVRREGGLSREYPPLDGHRMVVRGHVRSDHEFDVAAVAAVIADRH
jgi:hypothetical protein